MECVTGVHEVAFVLFGLGLTERKLVVKFGNLTARFLIENH